MEGIRKNATNDDARIFSRTVDMNIIYLWNVQEALCTPSSFAQFEPVIPHLHHDASMFIRSKEDSYI